MTKIMTLITLLLTFAFLSGCGSIARQLDSTWDENQTYQKSESLPPLEVSPDFTSKRTSSKSSEQG